ncbi:MAG: hypothetical protein J1F04_10095, partial [Oscillospiraceae bacterium]|nr:hypothetical protein [Oscillospiraceae bacterium]
LPTMLPGKLTRNATPPSVPAEKKVFFTNSSVSVKNCLIFKITEENPFRNLGISVYVNRL